jgi:hypothetical protein
MKFLEIDSKRFIVVENAVGLDDYFWFEIVEKKRLFRKPIFNIEPIYRSWKKSEFDTREKAEYFARKCICDYHDLIKRK